MYSTLVYSAFLSSAAIFVSASPYHVTRASFTLSNGQAAQAANAKFAGLSADTPCTSGETGCIQGQFAQCSDGKFVMTPCAAGLQCFVLPLVNKPGTNGGGCDTQADAEARIAATGAAGGITGKRSLLERAADAPPACAAKKRAVSSSGSIAARIAQQDLPQVAQSWQDLCLKSGGDITTNTPCVTLAGDRGINALLASGDVCDQQNVADDMITFAKSAGITNKQDLIDNAIAYRKHPRNALALDGGVTPSTPFCQNAPKNPELNDVVNGQLDGVNPGLFGGPKFTPVAFGDAVSCPRGQKPDVDSCTCA